MVWARAAFGAGTFVGDGVAFLAGWMSFLFTAVDAALYPSMFVSYLSAGKPLTLNPEPSTLNPQPSTLMPQPSTLSPQPESLNAH